MTDKEKSTIRRTPISKPRLWAFRIAALSAPLFVLLLLELALRIFDFGYDTKFFKQVTFNSAKYWTGNSQYGRRFFPPALARAPGTFAFPVTKPLGTTRIFVLGESAALGDPLPAFGFSRMLDRLLTERFPGSEFEVINLGVTAINSHVILPVAREAASKDADLWVVYMGNNEVVGPFGAGTVFGAQAPPLWMIRANIWIKQWRIGQLFDATLQRMRGGRGQEHWKGMELMARQRVPSFDPRMTNLYANFERNLHDILKAAPIPVILSTIGVNQKDCPPFVSVGATNEPHHAETHFRAGAALLKSNSLAEAKVSFQRAIDEDALRFRADSVINDIIRRATAAKVTLIDADKILASKSPKKISGDEFFLEHVHFTPGGNYELARILAQAAGETLGLKGQGTNWLSQDDCFAAIGFTDWNWSQTIRIILDRFEQPPFPGTLDWTNRVARIKTLDQKFKSELTPPRHLEMANDVLKAALRYPRDWELQYNAGVLLSLGGEYARATDALNKAIKILPLAPDPYFSLAGLLAFQRKHDQAIALYKECLRFSPENFDVLVRLGVVEFEQRQYEDAIVHLSAAARIKPDSIGSRSRLGASYLHIGKKEKAREQFLEVLKIDPGNSEAQELLRRAQ